MDSFSNKDENKNTTTTVEYVSYSTYYLWIFGLVLIVLAYFARDQLVQLYNVYLADSVKRFIGESILKMAYLSPNGEFMSTYIPKADAPLSITEIGLDELRLDP